MQSRIKINWKSAHPESVEKIKINNDVEKFEGLEFKTIETNDEPWQEAPS